MREELIKKACSLSLKAHRASGKPYLYEKSRSSSEAVFAFPGSWSVEDWFSSRPFGDTKASVSLFPSLRSIGNNEVAAVNEASFRRFEVILRTTSFENEVKKAVIEKKQIVFAGHSSGGPTAILATFWFLEEYIRKSSSPTTPLCVTFGSPLVGDRIIPHALRRENWDTYFIHFVMRYDIVPRLMLAPLSSIGRELQPVLHYFNPRSSYDGNNSVAMAKEAFFMNVMRNASSVASHIACNLMGSTNPLLETLTSLIELSPYRPFGTYVFCTGIGNLNTALNDLGMSTRDRQCLRAAGELLKQKQRNLDKINMNKTEIEKRLGSIRKYQSEREARKLGYCDSFKLQNVKDFRVNVNRLELAGMWDEIIEMLKKYELPCEFEGQEDWIKLGTNYRRLVEPLDIANFYRHLKNDDTGPYMIKGRPKRYRYTQRWCEHAERTGKGSSSESCFWAAVEELRSSNKKFEEMEEEIVQLETDLLKWLKHGEIGNDVILDESTFSKWWKTLPFDATNSRAHQSRVLVSNSENQNTREASKRWEDAAKSHGTKRIRRQLVIHRSSTAKRTDKQLGIHQWPFQRSAIGLPDRGHILSLSEKKIVRKTLKRKCRSMSVLSLVDRQQHVDRRWEDAAKNIGAKRICRQLVIHRVFIAKRICRQHGIHHRWPFERDWATKKGYSVGDERLVISLSTHAELVLRLQLIYISWLGRFSPRPSALPRGGLIVGPIALSSSEFAATNNLARRVGQDQRGSSASGSENERTREQEDPKEIRTSITIDDLLQLHGKMTRKDAAAILKVSVSTVKRKCQEYKIGPWKNGGRKRVWRPPDQHGEGNTSTTHETPSHNVQTGMEGEPVGQNQEANECRRDFMGRQIALNPESGLIMVSRPPDQHGERNTSTACETLSHNVQTGIEGVPVGQNQEANEFRPDFTRGSIHFNTGNGLIIGSSFGWASQVNDQSTLSTPYPNHDALGFPPPEITSMPSENMGGSIDLRNSLASQVVSDGHISGSTNFTFATCSDQAAPSQHVQGQSMHPTVYPDHNVYPQTQIVSSQEPFSEGQVFGFSNWNEHTNFVMIKACYGEQTKFKFLFPLTSGIVDLKKEVSKRLNVEVDRFEVKYKDKYEDLISIICDEDLKLYLWSSHGNDEIRVLVLDKVGGTPNFCESCRSLMQTRA